MTIVARLLAPRRAAVLLLAVGLFVFGFAIDGTSEVGHHAGLILGGVLVGWNLRD